IDSKTFNINPERISDKITGKTKAIIPVHLYGQAADMEPINELAKKYGVKVLEDAAQAHGSEYNGQRVGSLGDCAAFSFYATKNMITGEGGMVTTDNENLAKKLRQLRNHGQNKTYEHDCLGFNLRMMNLTAAIGLEQLKKLDSFNQKRISNANFLTKHLQKHIQTPHVSQNVKHVFHQYTIKTENRDTLLKKLNQNGVGARVYYPKPIHKQPYYQKLGYKNFLPAAEDTAKKVLSLPVHPNLKKEDLEHIVKTVKLNI
ncbi:MAG: DegT/DnrJ/EryC1/StrS family aminotransferase, partial [archaeon]